MSKTVSELKKVKFKERYHPIITAQQCSFPGLDNVLFLCEMVPLEEAAEAYSI